MTAGTPVDRAKADADYYAKVYFKQISDHRHPDHAVCSAELRALNEQVVRASGRDPHSLATGDEPTGSWGLP
jgi:hypothetical protein